MAADPRELASDIGAVMADVRKVRSHPEGKEVVGENLDWLRQRLESTPGEKRDVVVEVVTEARSAYEKGDLTDTLRLLSRALHLITLIPPAQKNR